MPLALRCRAAALDFEPNVVADHELITGQNPRSYDPIAAKLIEALGRTAMALTA